MKRTAALFAVLAAMSGVVPASASAAGPVENGLCASAGLLGVRLC